MPNRHNTRNAEDADSWYRPSARVIKPALAAISLALIALLAILAAASTAQADSNNIEWLAYQTEEDGFGYIRYQGSTLDDLEADLSASGCDLRGLWVYRNYEWDIYHTEAPAFLNAPFVAKYGGNLPHDTTITLQCRNPQHVLDVSIPDYDLEPTKIEWITTPEINTDRNKQGTAIIQYGGGSFYKLISRLAVEGCDVINVKVGDLEYDFRKPGVENQPFKARYDENILPHANMRVACVDRCDVIIGLDSAKDANWKKKVETKEKCSGLEFIHWEESLYNSDCYTDWTPRIQQVLQALPVHQDVCRVDSIEAPETSDRLAHIWPSVLVRGGLMFSEWTPMMFFYHIVPDFDDTKTYDFNEPRWDKVTAHEFCHHQQSWYTYKQYVNDEHLEIYSDRDSSEFVVALWKETPMAREFAEIVGFTQNHEGDWVPASDGAYRQVFSNDSPLIEMAAETCVFYLAEKVINPTLLSGVYELQELVVKFYSLQELEEWAEKYVLISP